MRRQHVIGQAQTGSGKTIAFTVGMVNAVDVNLAATQAICLAPTRELATQIFKDAVEVMARGVPGLTCELVVPCNPGEQRPRTSNSHILVGTPGSIKSVVTKMRDLNRTVKVFVCDEADEMVRDGGHAQDTIAIKNKLNPDVQTLLFSATFSEEVLKISKHLVKGKTAFIKLKSNDSLVLTSIKQVTVACVESSV